MQKFEVGQRVQIITLEELKKRGSLEAREDGFYTYGDYRFYFFDMPLAGEYGAITYIVPDNSECEVELENKGLVEGKLYVKSCFLFPVGDSREEAYKRMAALRNEADNIETDFLRNSRYIAAEDSIGVTEGKVYELKDGVFTDDCGNTFLIETPADFEFEIGVKFVRVKEEYELCEQEIPF